MTTPLAPELQQVLKGLALNRQPGWNFPGNFLEVSFDELLARSTRVSVDPGEHCLDANGQMSLAALSVLADIGMAATLRQEIGLATRMATVSMALQLTGAPCLGRIETRSQLDGFVEGIAGRHGLTRAEIYSGDKLVGTATGTFLVLKHHEEIAPLPTRRRGLEMAVEPLSVQALTDAEQAVFDRACNATQAGPSSFIDRFWGLLPHAVEGGALCDFPNGLHVGNRVGHTQGGITFTLAAVTANSALGEDWQLVGQSAWYVGPGTGAALRAQADIVHRGSQTAVIKVRISNPEGRIVLETVTNHARIGR